MNTRVVFALFVIMSISCALMGCKSWAPASSESGKCSQDRHWVAPQQDADGNWKEGYCEWDDGKA